MIEHEPIDHLCGNRNLEWSPVCSATPIPLGERVMVNTDKLVIEVGIKIGRAHV
jgi:hypothetical protein